MDDGNFFRTTSGGEIVLLNIDHISTADLDADGSLDVVIGKRTIRVTGAEAAQLFILLDKRTANRDDPIVINLRDALREPQETF